jgi:hypothetical protein
VSAFLTDARLAERRDASADMKRRREALRATGSDPDRLTRAQVAGLAGTMALLQVQREEREACRKVAPMT